MRMHCLLLTATLAVAAVGCTEPMPIDRISILAPGRAMRLTVHSEMQMSGVSGMEESSTTISSSGAGPRTTVTKREETPYTSVMWLDMELPLSVTAIPGSDSLRVTMRVHRFREGGSHTEKGEKKREEYGSFEAGDPIKPESESESSLRDTEFVAVIDPQGRLASADVTGKYWADIKKELAERVGRGNVSQAGADIALRVQTGGVFSALEDALAYLPPEGLQTGQSWKMRREHVLPYHAYAFYMFTRGGSHSNEEGTCTVRSVKARGLHSVATIAISGKRFPHYPERGMPRRVKHFDLKGELEINLTTGVIEKLRLESVPVLTWAYQILGRDYEIKLVYVITLKPT